MRLRLVLLLLVTTLMDVSSAPFSFGQATLSFAQLNGTVLDTSGRTLAGATVTLRNMSTNQSYRAVSNPTGAYLVPNLTPGQYELTVQTPGFAKYVQTGIALSVAQTATIDVTLRVASTGEVITVTTEAPPVEPSRTEISQVIDTAQIQELPTNGRRFVDFALLTPGVATGRTSLQSAARNAFAGSRQRVSRSEQQLRRRVRACAGWNRQCGYEIRH